MATGNDYLTDSMMKEIFPLCSAEKRIRFLPYLNLAMAYFQINTELRVSMFLAQLAHESTDLTRWIENLNYSSKRLRQVFPKYFRKNPALADQLAHKPQAIANYLYGARMGNRGRNTDDGWIYRGRSPMQATGREMYEALTKGIGRDFGVDFVKNPELLEQVQFGFLAAAWIFAVEKKCLPLADAKDIETCTRRINGGTNGLADRIHNYRTALRVLPDDFRLKSYEVFNLEMKQDEQIVQNAAKSDNQSRMQTTIQEAIVLNQGEPDESEDVNIGEQSTEPSKPFDLNLPALGSGVLGLDGAKEALIDAAKKLDPTDIEHKTPTGFWKKLVGIGAAYATGQAVLPEFIQSGLLNGVAGQILLKAFGLIAANLRWILLLLVCWFVLKKLEGFLIKREVIRANTDPTKGNVKLITAPAKPGIIKRFRQLIGTEPKEQE